jgi:uncharacterized protein (TIGR02001 family)
VSQTGNDPAVQGSISAHFRNFSATVWASNVSFADAEVDITGAYNFKALDSDFSVGAIYYAYPGSAPGTNYWEGFATWSKSAGPATLAAGVYVSPDYTLNSGLGVYSQASASIPIVDKLALNVQGGRQWIENNVAAGLPDYWRWSAGLGYTYDRFTVSVTYEDTDIPELSCATSICGPQVVAGLSASF